MKTITSICALLLIVAVASPSLAVLAVDPTPGTYNSSQDNSDPFPEGRGSQSNPQAGNAADGLDDVFNSQSWDGNALGAQWDFSCGVAPAEQTRNDNIDENGNGFITFVNTFVGGTFFLSKDGPWGDTVNDLTGTVNTTISNILVAVVGGQFDGSVGSVSTSGQFDGSDCVITFEINNLVGLGDTDLTPPFPANYPALLENDCDNTRVHGSWGDVVDLLLRIDCPVQTYDESWGSVKAFYR